MSAPVNHYKTLGVSESATAAEIKAAYRRKVKTAHPDTGGSAEAMQRLTEAYEELSTDLARSAYDARRRRREEPPRAQARPATQPSGQSNSANSTRSKAASSSAEEKSRSHERRQPEPSDPDQRQTAYERAQAEAEFTISHRQNMANTRRYVFAQIEEFGLLAALAGAALSFVSLQVKIVEFELVAGTLGFLALYWVILQFLYLILPELKLANYFTIRHPFKASGRDWLIFVITATLWFPIGVAWGPLLRLLFTAA